MKSVWIVAVLVVLASGAWAQIPGLTPRAIGMGGAAIGVADDAAAWLENPAGLPSLNVPCPEGKDWGHDIIGAFANVSDTDIFGVTWSGMKPSDGLGVGAGFLDIEDGGNVFGAGAGYAFRNSPFSVGANLAFLNPEVGDDQTVVNAGAMYRVMRTDRAPIKIGLTVNDITDEIGGAFWNVGVGIPVTEKLLVAIDVNDISDEIDTTVNGGVELTLGNQNEWKVRAGAIDTGDDHELTLGVGYKKPDANWRADFGFANFDPDALWTVGVGVNL